MVTANVGYRCAGIVLYIFFCMFEKLHNKKRHNMNANNFVNKCLLTTRWIKVNEHINTE